MGGMSETMHTEGIPVLSSSFSPEEINKKYQAVVKAFDSFNAKSSYDPSDAKLAIDIFANLAEILSSLGEAQKNELKLKVISLYEKISGEGVLLFAVRGALQKLNEVKTKGGLAEVSSVKEEPETPVS